MFKKFIIFSFAILFFFGGVFLAFAQEENGEDEITRQKLMAQIESLTAQLQLLQQQVQELLGQKQVLKEEAVALTRQLQEGMRGDDVKILQQALATDPEIYPEGLVTGYFGSLTREAVRRFQERAGIEQVGRVGPQTLWRVNEILNEGGVGPKGRVPSGLLRAPGIQRLLERVDDASSQKLDPENSDENEEEGDQNGLVEEEEEGEEENGE